MPTPGDYASLGPGVITIRILWRWWARRDSNLEPRDYESERPPEFAAMLIAAAANMPNTNLEFLFFTTVSLVCLLRGHSRLPGPQVLS